MVIRRLGRGGSTEELDDLIVRTGLTHGRKRSRKHHDDTHL